MSSFVSRSGKRPQQTESGTHAVQCFPCRFCNEEFASRSSRHRHQWDAHHDRMQPLARPLPTTNINTPHDASEMQCDVEGAVPEGVQDEGNTQSLGVSDNASQPVRVVPTVALGVGGTSVLTDEEESVGEDTDDDMGDASSPVCLDIDGMLYDMDTLSDMVNSYTHELVDDGDGGEGDKLNQTVRQLVDNMDTPVWSVGGATCDLTVFQAACLALSEKRTGGVKDTAFDRMCKIMSCSLLPPGNLYPKSKYLMERAIGCRTLEDVSRHVCPNECCMWDHLPKKEWKDHEEDQCPSCGERRFKTTLGGKLAPQKVFFYWGVSESIKSLFLDGDFVKVRGKGRLSDPYYTSEAASRLYAKAGCDLKDLNVSAYSIGVDGAQLFNSKVHSMWLILLQCTDMPTQYRTQRRFTKVVGIIPGPLEPRKFQTYLTPIANEFKEGEVSVHTKGGESFKHKFLLSGIAGDSPGMKKVTMHISHTAYVGCPYCTCRGERGPPAEDGKRNGMYFPPICEYGIYEPGERTGNVPNTGVGGRVGDEESKMSNEDQLRLAKDVRKGVRSANDVGLKGQCVFARTLKYWDYTTMMPIPLAHAALAGVVKDFVTLVLAELDRDAIRIIKQRATHFSHTCDIGRTYMCAVTKKGNYTMEHWLHFLEHDSIYIFMGLLPPSYARMWLRLRKSLCYLFRKDPIEGAADDIDECMEELFAFAVELEEVFGVTACKYNLHILLCQARDQEGLRGALWTALEFWIENFIQFAKSSVRYRATSNPEFVLVHDLCVDNALLRAKHLYGILENLPALLKELFPETDSIPGTHVDEGDTDGNQLLGAGVTKIESSVRDITVQALRKILEDTDVPGWVPGDESLARLTIFKRGDARGEELVHSRQYKRVRTRVSHYISCQYQEGDDMIKYMADVQWFAFATIGDKPVVRFAVANIAKMEKVNSDIGIYWRAYMNDTRRPGYYAHYGVRLEDMLFKMVKVDPPDQRYSIFIEYAKMSGSGRWTGAHGIPDEEEE